MASQNRLRDFKNNGKDSDELRRRRNDTTVELRKARKDEQLSKRRNIFIDEEESDGDTFELEQHSSPIDLNNSNVSVQISDHEIQKIVNNINSSDSTCQFNGVQAARKILSRERHPPIDIMINAGIVPRCIEFLRYSNYPDLQFETAWVLTNIASGNSKQTEMIVKAGGVDLFVDLLNSRHTNVVDQAVWALGNIAGDGPASRDMIISKGIIPNLLALSKTQTNVSFLRNLTWMISNLCRGKNPPPPQEACRLCLVALRRLLANQLDIEILSDACWAISYLSDGSNEKIEDVVQSAIIPRLVELLGCENLNIITPCLRAVGNIVTGSDSQADAAIKPGLLPHLANLMGSTRPNIVKESTWAVSNICAGTKDQIQAVVDAGIVPLLINILKHGDFHSQKEACWAVMNITSGGTIQHIIYLCKQGAIPACCNLLTMKDCRVIVVIIDALFNILKAASEVGEIDRVTDAIEECGGLDKLECLQSHENVQVYNKAYNIIDIYFTEGTDEDAFLLPDTEGTNGEFQITVRHNNQNFNM